MAELQPANPRCGRRSGTGDWAEHDGQAAECWLHESARVLDAGERPGRVDDQAFQQPLAL